MQIGMTAAMHAIENDHVDCLELLIAAGINFSNTIVSSCK